MKDLHIKANEYFELKKDPNWHPAVHDMKKLGCKMLYSHELAKYLLENPNLPVVYKLGDEYELALSQPYINKTERLANYNEDPDDWHEIGYVMCLRNFR